MRAGLVLVLAMFATSPAHAQTNTDIHSAPTTETAPAAFAATPCPQPADANREAADQHVVHSAMEAFNSGGFRALAGHLEELRGVLARAPSCYPEFERRGDTIIVRSDAGASTTLALLVGAVAQGQNVTIVQGPNPYPSASLLLGAYSDEMHDFEAGLAWLDRGLALQPHEQHLVLEKATALGQLHRFDEQVTLLQAELDDPLASLSLDRARFERNLGVALIDANRLDEAEVALRESIRLEPNNPRAEQELVYIARLRAGAAPTTATMTQAPSTPRR